MVFEGMQWGGGGAVRLRCMQRVRRVYNDVMGVCSEIFSCSEGVQ